jgi:hypothetical protein
LAPEPSVYLAAGVDEPDHREPQRLQVRDANRQSRGCRQTGGQMSRALVATGAALAALLLAGCSASFQVGGGVARTPSSAPLMGPALGQDEWLARGVVISADDGGMSKIGEQLKRYWFFQSQCSRGRCALFWTRPIDIGTLRRN